MSKRYVPVCQWCGKRGNTTSTNDGAPPRRQPTISGKCTAHPSGNPNMPHGPRWEED